MLLLGACATREPEPAPTAPTVALDLAGVQMIYDSRPEEKLTILLEGKPLLALWFIGTLPEAAAAAKLDHFRAQLADGTQLRPSRWGYRGFFSNEIRLSSADPARFALGARFHPPARLPSSLAVFEGSFTYLVASDPAELRLAPDQLGATQERHPLLLGATFQQQGESGPVILEASFNLPAYQVERIAFVTADAQEIKPHIRSVGDGSILSVTLRIPKSRLDGGALVLAYNRTVETRQVSFRLAPLDLLAPPRVSAP